MILTHVYAVGSRSALIQGHNHASAETNTNVHNGRTVIAMIVIYTMQSDHSLRTPLTVRFMGFLSLLFTWYVSLNSLGRFPTCLASSQIGSLPCALISASVNKCINSDAVIIQYDCQSNSL